MRQPEGRTEIFSQLQPMLLGYGHKNFHHFRIELRSRAALDFSPGMRKRQGFAVRPVADHGVERIGNREYTSATGNVVRFQAAWVSSAVKEFLVGQHAVRGCTQETCTDQHV